MFDHFAQLKESTLRHLDQAAAFARSIKRDTIAQQIELGRRHLADSRYNIAIVGNMKRGKSTLLNTLLGTRDDLLSPIKSSVCTAAIVHYLSREAHPENVSEARVFFDGREPQSVPVEMLREYITEDANPGNIKEVRSVDVYGDFPLLRNVVTLVDTPGRGATQRHHETLLEQFLPVADAIIFLISADLPIEASERAFLDQLSQQEKQRIFFVLTKRDEVSDKDIKEVRNWVMKNIRESGLSCDRLFEVSARPVFEAACAGKDGDELARLRRDCGVAELESELESELEKYIIANSETNAALLPRIQSLLDYVSQFYFEATGQAEKDPMLLDGGAERTAGEVAQLQSEADALRASCTKQPTMTVDKNGNKIWRLNGMRHKVDGPAIECVDGHKAWYLHGKLHREDGPATEYANGDKTWWLHGKCHREDGPATEYGNYENGNKEWYLNDKMYKDVFEWAEALLKSKGNNEPSEHEVTSKVQQVTSSSILD